MRVTPAEKRSLRVEDSRPFRLEDLRDATLRDLAVAYRRSGDRRLYGRVKDIIATRTALRECWFAREDGVAGTGEFWRQFDEPGGRERFLAGEGTCPSYKLAVILDYESWLRTGRSALRWGEWPC